MEEKILKIIQEKINPKLLEHQGWIELAEIVGNDIYIRFRGACSGCMSTKDTFEKSVKPELMKEVKEIHDVIIKEEINEELIDFARSLLNKSK